MKNKNNIKIFLSGFIFCLIITNTIVFGESIKKSISVEFRNIKLVIDGVERITKDEPFLYNDKAYVPLRLVSESLGKDVTWDGKNNKIYIGITKEQAENGYDIKSSDDKTQISLLPGWKEDDNTNIDAKLTVRNKDAYIMIIQEDKSSFSDDTSIDDYTNIIKEHMLSKAKNPSISESNNLLVNGYNSKQFEFVAEISNYKLTYLVTIIETPTSFYQVIGWTTQDVFEKNKDMLNKIVQTFKELQ